MADKLVYSWADKLWQRDPPRKYIATRYRQLKTMKRILTYTFGLITGIALMTVLYLMNLDNSYIVLGSDYQISDIGYINKGTKLKIENGFSEGFTQYSLILNLSDSEESKLLENDKWNLTIPYWLLPINKKIEVEGDLYFKLISLGSFYNVPNDKKKEFLAQIDSLRQCKSIAKQEKQLVEMVDLLTKNELIDKPFFHLKLDSSRVITVYLNQTDFDKISIFNRQELINEGMKISLKISGEEISDNVFHLHKILDINKIEGKTFWRK